MTLAAQTSLKTSFIIFDWDQCWSEGLLSTATCSLVSMLAGQALFSCSHEPRRPHLSDSLLTYPQNFFLVQTFDSQARQAVRPVSRLTFCSNWPLPLSKLVTSCTSKGIWFIRAAAPQDFERPSTCLSKLTFLAISIYFACPFMWFSQGCSPLMPKVCQLLMSIRQDFRFFRGPTAVTQITSVTALWRKKEKVWHNGCILMVRRLADDTLGKIPSRAGLIDSLPLKPPVF